MAAKKSEKKLVKEVVALDPSTGTETAVKAKAPRARKATAAAAVDVTAVVVEPVVVTPVVAAPVVAAPVVAAPSPEAIRARAHALFLAEGGQAFDNWLRAERELTAGPAMGGQDGLEWDV